MSITTLPCPLHAVFTYALCLQRPQPPTILRYKDKALQFKKFLWTLLVETLKEHSAVVVKKKFRLRKAFNFFKDVY